LKAQREVVREMAIISIDISTHGTRIQDAFAASYAYQATINGQPNPESKAQFTKRKIAEYVKDVVRAYEANKAAEDARVAALSGNELTIT
jgi:hypothetical protein